MNTDYFIYAIIVVGVFTIYMALVNIFRRDRVQERLQDTLHVDYNDDKDNTSLLASFCSGVLSLLNIDYSKNKDISKRLARAGMTSLHAPAYYMFFKRIVQPFFFVLGVLILAELIFSPSSQATMDVLFKLLLGFIFLVIGFAGANLYVTNSRQRRQKILLLSFPEALDLMLVCIESGLGLDAALARVCKEMRGTHPLIISELDRTRIELTMMSDRMQALQNLADRTDMVQFKSLVSALIQTEKFGTSLIDTLRVLSDDIRTTRLMSAENRAARIPVLITIPLIFCMLPAFIIIILGPPVVRVVEQGGIFGESSR